MSRHEIDGHQTGEKENERDKQKTTTGGLYNLLRCCDLYSAVVLKRIAHCILLAIVM